MTPADQAPSTPETDAKPDGKAQERGHISPQIDDSGELDADTKISQQREQSSGQGSGQS